MTRTLILLFILLVSSFSTIAGKKAVKLCYEDVEIKPYFLGTEQIPDKPGYVVDLIKHAVNTAGAKLVLIRQPWKRCILNVTRGEVDGLFAIIKTPEREKWAEFPSQKQVDSYLIKIAYPIYVRRGRQLSWNGNQFTGVKFGIAAPAGYVARKLLVEEGIYPKDGTNLDLARGLKMVAMGRLDGYVVNKSTGDKTLKELGLENSITTLPIPFMYSYLHLAYSKPFFSTNKACAEQVWNQIAVIRNEYGDKMLSSYQMGSKAVHVESEEPSSEACSGD